MVLARVVILLTLVSFNQAVIERERLAKFPPKLLNFQTDLWLEGQWHQLARIPPCSWSGNIEFTDWEERLYRDGATIVVDSTWRNDHCISVKGRYTPRGQGCFLGKDSIGNVWTGIIQVAAIQYDHFVIYWSCTKVSVFGGKCEDYSVNVFTRELNPPMPRLEVVRDNLLRLWGLSWDDMHRDNKTTACPGEQGTRKQGTRKQERRRFKLY